MYLYLSPFFFNQKNRFKYGVHYFTGIFPYLGRLFWLEKIVKNYGNDMESLGKSLERVFCEIETCKKKWPC